MVCGGTAVVKAGEAFIGYGVDDAAAGHRIELVVQQLFAFGLSQFTLNGLAHDFLHPSSADHPSLVRPHWRDAVAAPVNRFTGGTQIRQFVMANTGRRAKKDSLVMGVTAKSPLRAKNGSASRTMQTINLCSVDGDNHDVRYARLSGSLGCLVLRNRPCRSTIQHLRYPHGRNHKRSTRDAG
jgi:hypothetical protein